MKVNTLVSTIEDDIPSLLDKMNVEGEVLVSAQNDNNEIYSYETEKFIAQIYEIEGRGVSRNRNLLMMQSRADILIFADDDLIFHEDYAKAVKQYYEILNADMILFNLGSIEDHPANVTQVTKITKLNYQRYGGARFTVKRSSIEKEGIFFNTTYGGGSPIGSGEDTLFLKSCLDAKLKLFIVPESIAYIDPEGRESTWFKGYNEKFFRDKGFLFKQLHGWKRYLYILRFILIHKKRHNLNYSLRTLWNWMVEGNKEI